MAAFSQSVYNSVLEGCKNEGIETGRNKIAGKEEKNDTGSGALASGGKGFFYNALADACIEEYQP